MPDPNQKKVPPPMHSRAAQVSAGGYSKGQHVIHGGVIWVSLVASITIGISTDELTTDATGLD
jgi:hypothetical protein